MTEKQMGMRLPENFIDRADALIPAMNKDPNASMWGQVTRSTVLRVAIGLGLTQLEQKYGKRPPMEKPTRPARKKRTGKK